MEDARLKDMRGRTERLKAAKDASGDAGSLHGEGATLEGTGKQLEGAVLSEGASASGIVPEGASTLDSLPEQLGPPRANEEWKRFYEAIRDAVLKQRE
ncbi:hypothetical protein ACX93W_11680 [Paenibacillus sp. CAU 1782]